MTNCFVLSKKCRSKLKQHIKETHKEEYLTCNFCDKVCKTRNNLTNHIWIMHEEGDFSCPFDECDFSSKFRKNLLNHKKLRHQRVRKCPMNDCGEMIPITRYQRHMSSLHKIKNYACSWPDCGKSFADHNALKNHVRIHLNFKVCCFLLALLYNAIYNFVCRNFAAIQVQVGRLWLCFRATIYSDKYAS